MSKRSVKYSEVYPNCDDDMKDVPVTIEQTETGFKMEMSYDIEIDAKDVWEIIPSENVNYKFHYPGIEEDRKANKDRNE